MPSRIKKIAKNSRYLFIGFLTYMAFAMPAFAQNPTKSPSPASSEKGAETRGIMDGLFGSLIKVLPMSYDSETFSSPGNRPEITAALRDLANNTQKLDEHAHTKDPTFSFIAKSLQRDVKDIYRWYVRGSYGEARYLIHNVTENCIACHSRQAETAKFPPAKVFFKNIDVAKISIAERAQLQTALRQFDDAIASFEELFASPDTRPAEIVMMDSFTDYLKLCIRVKDDYKRPILTLEKMMQRKDLPKFAKIEIELWIKSLKAMVAHPPKGVNDLAIAKNLVQGAKRNFEFRNDRAGLIEYIVASRYLNRFIATNPPNDAQAEAYYFLGITESMIGRTYWLSQTEFFLETAIRLAPKAPFAEKAYALFEEQIMLEFSGSSGTNIPQDIQTTLDELRTMMQAKKQ